MVLKEYLINGRKWRMHTPTAKQKKALQLAMHNMQAHQLNGNQANAFLGLADLVAAMLVPEGAVPGEDLEAIKEEVLDFPFRFFVNFHSDLEALRKR